ncbi:MAG: TonB-dependent receptor [Opitutales bacterium]|nr:TonB-dependent receptor [Opitutales bacterium]
MPTRVSCVLTMAALCAALPFGSFAADEEVFELSPFEVRAGSDRGYTATASLIGGRLAGELRDTAASVTVFTTELLADLGAANFLEAARWAPNAVPQQEIHGKSLYNDYAVSFRGLGGGATGGGFQSRNYFRWYINSDAFSTGRIEFARGPNSLVFGDAFVGGVGNVVSKQALGTGQYEVEVKWSSFGGFRTVLDADLKVTDSLNVRAALVYQDFDDWRDVGGDKRRGIFLTARYQPNQNTTLRAEVEWGKLERIITYQTLDQLANWDGVTTNAGFLGPRDSVPSSLARWNQPRLAFNSARPDLGIVNWEGFAATSGVFGRGLKTEPQEGMPDFAVIPSYKFSLQAPNAGVDNPYWTASVFLERRIGENLFIEVAGNYQYQERDITRWFFDQLYVEVNETLPSGEPNPYLGDFYGWARYWRNVQSNEVGDARISAAYLLDTSLTEQRLLLVGGHRFDRFEDHNHERVRTNGPNPDVRAAANRIFAYRYLSERDLPVIDPPDFDPVSGIESRVAKTNGFFSEKPVTYLQAAASGRWLENRALNTLFGVRRDHYRENINDAALDERAPVSGELIGFGPKLRTDSQKVTSYTASAVYHFTDNFGVFAGYSESFDAGSTARGLRGDSLPPLLSEGREAGIKFQLWENRLVGTVTYYESEQSNNRLAGQAQPINEIWSLIGRPERGVPDAYRDRQTFEGTGWEIDLTAMPTPNWRLLFNISFPETAVVEGLIDTRDYYEANVGEWRSAADAIAAGGDPARANNIRTRIDRIEDAIASVETGRRLDNSFRYTANFFTRYYFSEGIAEGFSVGGGVNVRGRRLVGNEPGDPFAYVYANGYALATFLLGYDRAIGNGHLSLQLNVNNVFDREIVRPANLGFVTQDPRQFILSARYQF